MNTRVLLAGAALAALSLFACSKPATSTDTTAANSTANTSDATTAAAGPAGTGTAPASPAAAPAPTAAAGFVEKAASTDMFEIAEAKMAQQKATSADVKAFAAMMIKDHTKSTADLKAAIAKSGQSITPPAALPADLQAKVDALGQTSKADFDKTYIGQQVDAHTNALAVMQTYASSGDTPALKDFAANTSKVVQMHLDKAKALQANMK